MGSWFDPLFDFYSAWSYKRDEKAKYDFSRVPDLLIGGEEVDIFRLDVPTSSGGAQGHPDIEGHRTACEYVVNYVRQKNLI